MQLFWFSVLLFFSFDVFWGCLDASISGNSSSATSNTRTRLYYITSSRSLWRCKTELVIFKSKTKIITKHLHFCLSVQKIKPSSQLKYLGIILQDNLHWNSHLTKPWTKLSHSIGLLSKVRYYVPKYYLRTI